MYSSRDTIELDCDFVNPCRTSAVCRRRFESCIVASLMEFTLDSGVLYTAILSCENLVMMISLWLFRRLLCDLRWNVELQMAISEQSKSLNSKKKKEKFMHWWSRKRQQNEEEKWKKKASFAIRKTVFFFLLFFGCSFGFAFQRWFVELERALL